MIRTGLDRWTAFPAIVAAAASLALPGCDSPERSPSSSERAPIASAPAEDPRHAVLRLEREWASALTRKDLAWFERHLARDFRTVLGSGQVMSRDQVIEHVRRSPPALDVRLDQGDVRTYPNAAVATVTQSFARRSGGRSRLRISDVWIRSDDGRWVVVHSHETPLAATQQ